MMYHGPRRHKGPSMSPKDSEGRLKRETSRRMIYANLFFHTENNPNRYNSHKSMKCIDDGLLDQGNISAAYKIWKHNILLLTLKVDANISRVTCNFEIYFWSIYFVEDCSAKGIRNLENMFNFLIHLYNNKFTFCQLGMKKAFKK